MAAASRGDSGAVQVYVVSAVTTRGDVTTYQVPLTFYPDRREGLDAALVGELGGPDGPTYVDDGAHDPAFVREWLALIDRQASATGAGGPSAQEGVSKEVFVPINEDQKVLRGLLGVG